MKAALVAVVAPFMLGALMTGVEHLIDAGVSGATGDWIFLFNSAYCLIATLFLIFSTIEADQFALWDKISYYTKRDAGDGHTTFVVLTFVCGVMYLAKVALIYVFALPYSHPWTTPFFSLAVLLIPPLIVFLVLDFGLARGRSTARFFQALKSVLYRLVELVMTLVFFPWRSIVIALSLGKYLHSGKVSSTGYEIQKLVAADFSHSVYFDTQAHTYLIVKVALCQEIVKIDSTGSIIGRLQGPHQLSACGICFGDSDYIDWPISGNASVHPYVALFSTDKLSNAELTRHFDECEGIELFAGSRAQAARCYLKVASGWIALETPADPDGEASQNSPFAGLVETQYGDKLGKRLSRLAAQPESAGCEKKAEGKIQLQRLAINSYLSPRYAEFNWLQWHGWYGTGIFQLRHHDERIRFKAFAAKIGAEYFNGLHPYEMPLAYRETAEVTFFQVENPFGTRSKDQPGLYIVRPRTRPASDARGVDAAPHRSHYVWRPVIRLIPNKGRLIHLQYANGLKQTKISLRAGSSSRRPQPSEIKFFWNRVIGKRSGRLLYLNGRVYHWGGGDKFVFGVMIVLSFDDGEIEATFDRLSAPRRPIAVEIVMEDVDQSCYNGNLLTVRATNGIETIPLRRTALCAAAPAPELDWQGHAENFEKYLLKREHTKAIANLDMVPAFEEVTNFLLANSQCIKEYAKYVTFYVMKVLFRWTVAKEFTTANRLLSQYIDVWLPILGPDEYTPFIASEGLALGIVQRDKKFSDAVFKNVLGPQFDIAQLTNDHLLFNLACYYAVNHDKDRMLVAIKLAITHGTEREKFSTDTDFTDYWQDRDFQKVVSESLPIVKTPDQS